MASSVGTSGTIARLNVFASTKREKSCPTCRDSGIVIYDTHSGDQICNHCGQVLEARVMSEEQEWRSFANDGGGGGVERSRVGGPNDSWLDDSVGGTTMMGGDKKFGKLAQAHDLVTGANASDRQLKTAFANLRYIGDHFRFSNNMLERAREIIKDLQTLGHLKSRTGITNMLAVVFLAAREDSDPVPISSLTSFDRGLTEKDIAKAVNKLRKLLPQNRAERGGLAATFASRELVLKLAPALSLAACVTDLAAHVCTVAETQKLSPPNSRPHILAGAALYLACQVFVVPNFTAIDIACTAQCGVQSLIQYYAALVPNAKALMPRGFIPRNVGGLSSLARPEDILQKLAVKPAD